MKGKDDAWKQGSCFQGGSSSILETSHLHFRQVAVAEAHTKDQMLELLEQFLGILPCEL